MNKTIARCVFIVATGAYLILAIVTPWVLSDGNIFLKNFVNHEFLNLLGVIVAITLASAGNLHLEFNKLEELAEREFLGKTRTSVQKSAFWLISFFLLAFLITIVKPLLPQTDIATALVNGLAVLVVIFNVLVLIDLTQLVFKTQPSFKIFPRNNTNEKP